jgi:hypothetical protein
MPVTLSQLPRELRLIALHLKPAKRRRCVFFGKDSAGVVSTNTPLALDRAEIDRKSVQKCLKVTSVESADAIQLRHSRICEIPSKQV